MTLTLALLIALCVGCEIAREVLFKLADMQREIALPLLSSTVLLPTQGVTFRNFVRDIFAAPLIWAGITLWGIEIAAWLDALSRAPISYVFPFMSLCYCGTLPASHWLLGEKISTRQWAGAGLITAGVAAVGLFGQAG